MEVLAYLLSDSPSSSPEPDAHEATRILLGGSLTEDGDEQHLRIFSNVLLDLKRGSWASLPLITSRRNTDLARRGDLQCFTYAFALQVVRQLTLRHDQSIW